MKRVNYHFTEIQLARLRAISEKTGLPVAELVRRAIDAYLMKEDARDENKGKKRDRS